MMQAQKMMVFLAPFFGLFGLGFPLGVLMYWVTSNSWTLAQQHYIYKRYPQQPSNGANGSRTGAPAGKAKTAKAAATAAAGAGRGKNAKGRTKKDAAAPADTAPKPKVVRNQPTRKPRSKRSGSQKR